MVCETVLVSPPPLSPFTIPECPHTLAGLSLHTSSAVKHRLFDPLQDC